jgi:DnaK suppressor protein
MATKKNTTSKTALTKKPVAKSASKVAAKPATTKKVVAIAKKVATKSGAKVATKTAVKAPAKAEAKKSAKEKSKAPSKVEPKKPIVKAPAKKSGKQPVAKAPAKIVKKSGKKPVAKKPLAKESEKKPVAVVPPTKKSGKKLVAEVPPKAVKKTVVKEEKPKSTKSAVGVKKASKTSVKKPKQVVETSVVEVVEITPKATGMRTPTVKPVTIGKPAGVLKPNYGLIRPKHDGKKTGSVRQVTRSPFKDEDLEEFKRRLLDEREKKVKLQNAMSTDALSRPDEENVEEDGTNSSNRADMLQRAEETRRSLRAIDDALRAIENKTYGICSVCKCAISRERLRAAPFAIRCVKCKEEWERQVKASKRTMQ